MSCEQESVEKAGKAGVGGVQEGAAEDLAFEQALGDFRASVHAWSEAAYRCPRTAFVPVPQHRFWRLAAGWALGCAMVSGVVSGGVYEHRRRQETARIAAAQAAEQQRRVIEQRAREEEDLLARVDSAVSQQVPDAMEPLARLMAEDESR